MKILSNREYDQLVNSAVNKAFIEGYNLGKQHQSIGLEREFERGRISLNEYRRLAYDLPPIEKSANIEEQNERVSR